MHSVDKIATDVAATKGEEDNSIEKQDFGVMKDEDNEDTAL